MKCFLPLVICLGLSTAVQAGEPAAPSTVAANVALLKTLPLQDRQDYDFASRGFLGSVTDPRIVKPDGSLIWNTEAWDFISGDAPETVNPSLWRHAGLLAKHGLFQASERVWQVRGFDISNMTLIRGDTGWILVDPLTTDGVAKAALDLANAKLGKRPVVAVIYTHSHSDHFGGARGVVDQADVDSGKIKIIAPSGFLEHAVSENVLAGAAMSRRANYQFGYNLAPGPQGQISSGIGQAISRGNITLIPPNVTIDHTGQTLTIDGVRIVFQVTPGTEAPSEMNFFFPDLGVLCMAENANVSMHNILTPRGALVRDAKAWADYLTESIQLFGAGTKVMIASHGWPRFGHDETIDYLASHRDTYKYLHDQTVRLMNRGLTGTEIAEQIHLPAALEQRWFNRGYYGTMRFNSRAVYQRYMGWYDANPVHLAELPPAEEGRHYVEAMGGAAKVIALAKTASDQGDYRWASTLLNNVVMADSSNREARDALASAYEQMGYQAESAIWRNMYLVGAGELRSTAPLSQAATIGVPPDLVRNMPSAMLFDLLAVRLDPEKAASANLRLVIAFPERNEKFLLELRNGVLISQATSDPGKADATLTLPRDLFLDSLFNGTRLAGAVVSGKARIEGRAEAFQTLLQAVDRNAGAFPIITRQ
jgi:alkyl sulfatase BDS1-like metallo-beta-lactamase superfamily hydrolase